MLLILSSDTHTHTSHIHYSCARHPLYTGMLPKAQPVRREADTFTRQMLMLIFLQVLSLSFATGGIIFLRCSMCNLIPPCMPLAAEGFLHSFVLRVPFYRAG